MVPASPIGRRHLFRLGLAGAATGLLAACGRSREGGPATSTRTPPASRVLVAYFSRPGENYHYGDRTWLEIGNTEVVATAIAEILRADVHKIEPAEPYPDDYDQTVQRNVREQNTNARPGIANPLPGIGQYDVVLLGSPIWNVRAPMIMTTFAESHDFAGRTVHPFTTHAMSGLGRTASDYGEACAGATIGEGLAVQGEQAREARPALTEWLGRIGLTSPR